MLWSKEDDVLVANLFSSDSDSDSENDSAADTAAEEIPAQRKQRKKYKRGDPYTSDWYKFGGSEHGDWEDPTHRDGKLFRRRFRVPWTFFKRLLDRFVFPRLLYVF